MDLPLWFALLVAGYAVAGLVISFLCYRDDAAAREWRVSDWIAAVAASPLVVVEFWIESLRQR